MIAFTVGSIIERPYGWFVEYTTFGKTTLAMPDVRSRFCVRPTIVRDCSRSSASCGNVGFSSMSARIASVGASLSFVERNDMRPDSRSMSRADARAQQLQIARQLLAGAMRRALGQHLRDEARQSGLVRRLVLTRRRR